MTRRWIPTNTASKLILADTILAGVVPHITDTWQRIIDLIPGHSGRPAGTGDPPGGQGGSTTSVVERTLGIAGDDEKTRGVTLRHSTERADLDRLDRYVATIDMHTRSIVELAGGRLPQPPLNPSLARRLVWDRWALRVVIELNPKLPDWITRDLCDAAADLERLINAWRPAAKKTNDRDPALAIDDTDTWCRSHLRCGHRVHRDPRYRTQGICRWCGDFHAQQGYMPTLDLIDAYESGKRITMAMVDQHRPTRGKKKRK